MNDYQINYDQNTSRKSDRLSEMNLAIESQDNYCREIDRTQEQQESCLNMFFKQKNELFRQRTVWKAWRAYFAVYKSKSRKAAYTRNTLHRGKMNRLFTSWRKVTYNDFHSRIEIEKKTFRDNLEGEILVQWSTKVDALSLYVAELEDKIRQE